MQVCVCLGHEQAQAVDAIAADLVLLVSQGREEDWVELLGVASTLPKPLHQLGGDHMTVM